MPSIAELENRVRSAHQAFYALKGHPLNYEKYTRLLRLCSEAEADLAAEHGEPYARVIDPGFNYSPDSPRLLQSTKMTLLVVGTHVRVGGAVTDSQFKVLRFLDCCWTTFGHPNDEAIDGHPLSGRGLEFLSVCEVFNSPWNARMREQNKVSFPNFEMAPVRHLIFTFKEQTFECLCSGWEVVYSSTDFGAALNHAASLV